MLIPILVLFVSVSVAWLAFGIRRGSGTALFLLNLVWWAGALGSAYGVWLAWLDRGYSEHWAAFGFLFFSLPYGVIAASMAGAELLWTRKWAGARTAAMRRSAIGLLAFLALQLAVGFLSL